VFIEASIGVVFENATSACLMMTELFSSGLNLSLCRPADKAVEAWAATATGRCQSVDDLFTMVGPCTSLVRKHFLQSGDQREGRRFIKICYLTFEVQVMRA
jgi:hypothetical protein